MMPPGRVLVAEDDVDIREALADVLRGAGYEVWCAVNGLEALTWLGEHGSEKPTVVILDVLMPVMNGRAFLAAKAAKEDAVRDIPVLLYTASSLDAGALLALPSVRGLVRKPTRTEELLATVGACFSSPTGDASTGH